MKTYICENGLYGKQKVSAINVFEAAKKYLIAVSAGKGLRTVTVQEPGAKKAAEVTLHWSQQRR